MQLQLSFKIINTVAFLLIGFLWGLNWPAVKFILTEIPPLTMRAISFTAAACILAAVVRFLKQPLSLKKNEAIPTALIGLFLIFGFNILTTFGQMLLETSKATIIAYTMPSLTATLAAIYLGERIGLSVLAALILAMGGLIILASENFLALIKNPLGPTIMMFAALSWAIGNVGLKSRTWLSKPLALTMWFFVFSSLAIWPLVFIYEPLGTQNWPNIMIIGVLIFHILGPMITCYLLWALMVSRLSVTIASISVLTAPVVGVLSSALLLGDTFTWQKLVALMAIILSISLVTFQGDEKAKRKD